MSDNILQQTSNPEQNVNLSGSADCSKLPPENNTRKARVLIVDDSAVARKILRDIITALGHIVVGEAENGAQAFVEYSHKKPEIVTMDLTMKGINGAEATTKILAIYPDAKIIVISAIEERQVILDALERGARHFIVKPISRDKVTAAINGVLGQKFDYQKQLAFVRNLKGTDKTLSKGAIEYQPPYQISMENKILWIKVNVNLSLSSIQSLFVELGEYLGKAERVLLDFGEITSMNEKILLGIDKLIKIIEDSPAKVKAVSRDKAFVDFCTETDKYACLAAAIQYLAI